MLNMTSDEFLDAFGGTFAVAKLLGIRPPSVTAWRGRYVCDIPEDKLIRLAPAAEVRGIATRRELLPDSFEQIWPELANQAHAQASTQEVSHG